MHQRELSRAAASLQKESSTLLAQEESEDYIGGKHQQESDPLPQSTSTYHLRGREGLQTRRETPRYNREDCQELQYKTKHPDKRFESEASRTLVEQQVLTRKRAKAAECK